MLLFRVYQFIIALSAATLLLLIKFEVLPGYAFGVALATGMILSLGACLLAWRR